VAAVRYGMWCGAVGWGGVGPPEAFRSHWDVHTSSIASYQSLSALARKVLIW
jgi:hypothetical protein